MADFRSLVLDAGVHKLLHGPDALVVDILKLSAGAAGPGLASFYMTPGALLAAPESGAIESDGTNLYWTDALGARHSLSGPSATLAATYNFGGAAADQTLGLLDAKGGAFIVDGTAVGFTGTYAMQVKSTSGGLVNFPRVGGLEVVKDQNDTTLFSVTNVTNGVSARAAAQVAANGGSVTMQSLGPAYTVVPSWANSATVSTDFPTLNIAATAASGAINLITGSATGVRATINSDGSMLLNGAAANPTSSLAISPTKTLASPAAGSVWNALRVEAGTLTATMGAGNVTVTMLATTRHYQPTITTAGGVGTLTVTNAYTMYVDGPPVGAGSATLSNTWALGVNGDISLTPTIPGINRTLDYGAGYGAAAIYLYNPGIAGQRWGWGLAAAGGEMQFFMRTTAGNHFSWNTGGGLQTVGTNELMRLAFTSAGNAALGIGTTPATASALHVVDSPTVTAAAGAVWNAINFGASTLTLTGATTPITSLNFMTVAAPTVTAASAVATTDFFTCRIAAATFTGAGPASATRNWALGVDGNTKLGGGLVTFGRQITIGMSAYPVTQDDFALEVQSDGGAITLNLPALTGGTVLNGRIYVVIDSGYSAGASNITLVRGNAGDKINNTAASYVVSVSGACLWLRANTTNNNWEIV